MSKNCDCFNKTLCYSSPAHGGWGMVRVGMSVPESFQIFFSPPACGRHGAVSAVFHKFRNRLAYYFLDEKDVVSGGYEQQIFKVVDVVLKRLEKKPKAMLLFVTCIDDLMGTDLEALTLELNERFSNIDFVFCHMNPIREDSKLPPGQNIQHQIYTLLKKKNLKNDSINCIGNLLPIDKECEIYTVLKCMGIDNVNHIMKCNNYNDFQDMASSKYNFLIEPNGLAAVNMMEKDLGIPYEDMCVSFDLNIIDKQYEKMLELFSEKISEKNRLEINGILSNMKLQAYQEIEKTKELIGDLPIYIDLSAIMRPYQLAWFLYKNGFNIKGIFSEKPSKAEHEAWKNIINNCPDIKIMTPQNPKTMLRNDEMENALSIGFEAAYITQSKYVLNLFNDEGMFGYYGVIKLMKMIRSCYENPVGLKDLIESYGLVV